MVAPDDGASETGTGSHVASGELRSLALERLKAAAEPVGPAIIARALQRSADATANWLERLVDLGFAESVSEHARRYTPSSDRAPAGEAAIPRATAAVGGRLSELLAEVAHDRSRQERLGHSSITITADLYSHVREQVDRDAADRTAD